MLKYYVAIAYVNKNQTIIYPWKDYAVQNIPGFDEQKTLLFNNFLHLMFFNIF